MTKAATKTIYRIRDLANEFDVTLRALRYYEDKGLLSPYRAGTTRRYSENDRIRLKRILQGKRMGLPLDRIKGFVEAFETLADDPDQLVFLVEQFERHQAFLLDEFERVKSELSELEKTLATLREMNG